MAIEKTFSLSVDASVQIGDALLPFAANIQAAITNAKSLSDVRDAPAWEQAIPLGGVPVNSMRLVIIRNMAEAPTPLRVQVGVVESGTWEANLGIRPLGDILPGDCAIIPAVNPGVIMWRGFNRDTNVSAVCPAQILIVPI